MSAITEFKAIPQPPVEADEMAFAIALFMGAASGRIAPPSIQSNSFLVTSSVAFAAEPLLAGAASVLAEQEKPASDEVPLACAVSVLWHHYEGDARQQAICARLVAFYALMVRSKGVLLEPWMEPSAHDSQTVLLTPVIVEAVARAPLGESGQFNDLAFRDIVQTLAGGGHELQAPAIPPGKLTQLARNVDASLPVTEAVHQLSLHLFAFQACVAKIPNLDGVPQFHVVEQLCGEVASISGTVGLQAMLSRALAAARSEFPWLQAAKASKAGTLEGLDRIAPPPDVREAIRCEMAILESLIELLRSLLGEGTTIALLRTLWPLAILGTPQS